MVCSTQPYGNEVKYSSAPKMLPAIVGESRIDNEREPATASVGNVKSKLVDAEFASVPAPLTHGQPVESRQKETVSTNAGTTAE